LVEETGVPGEKYLLATSHYITYYYMTSDNVFSDWLTSLVMFFDKTLYSTCKKSICPTSAIINLIVYRR
jgi:hypothetical protein